MRIAMLCLLVTLGGCASAEPPVLPLVAAVGFDKLEVVVINQGASPWHDVTLAINPTPTSQGYTFAAGDIKAGQRWAKDSRLFASAEGARLNVFQTKPIRIGITATIDGQTQTRELAFTY